MTRGRPREFDPDAALDHALAVFERDGFEATTVQTLADAMGICKPSLYAAYGNKEALFISAVQRYAAACDARRAALLDAESDGRRAVEAMLRDAVHTYTACESAGGCLVVAQAAGASPETRSDAVRAALADAMNDGRALLRARLARASSDGDLPTGADVDTLASYFATVMAGLSVLARNGGTRDALTAVVTTAMGAWPMQLRYIDAS
jgi:AcrR family transcriptional regulator